MIVRQVSLLLRLYQQPTSLPAIRECDKHQREDGYTFGRQGDFAWRRNHQKCQTFFDALEVSNNTLKGGQIGTGMAHLSFAFPFIDEVTLCTTRAGGC